MSCRRRNWRSRCKRRLACGGIDGMPPLVALRLFVEQVLSFPVADPDADHVICAAGRGAGSGLPVGFFDDEFDRLVAFFALCVVPVADADQALAVLAHQILGSVLPSVAFPSTNAGRKSKSRSLSGRRYPV